MGRTRSGASPDGDAHDDTRNRAFRGRAARGARSAPGTTRRGAGRASIPRGCSRGARREPALGPHVGRLPRRRDGRVCPARGGGLARARRGPPAGSATRGGDTAANDAAGGNDACRARPGGGVLLRLRGSARGAVGRRGAYSDVRARPPRRPAASTSSRPWARPSRARARRGAPPGARRRSRSRRALSTGRVTARAALSDPGEARAWRATPRAARSRRRAARRCRRRSRRSCRGRRGR